MIESRPTPRPLVVVTAADPAATADPPLAIRKNELYAAAARVRGADVATVTSATPAAERDDLLARMDGLLLAGGTDLDPSLYGETPAGATDLDLARDALEQAAWRAAATRSVPVLGVCRGLQAINVFSGGKLIQDVPEHAGVPYGQGPAKLHYLEIAPDSRLGRAIASAAPDGVAGADPGDRGLELEVNTFHHQAVDGSTLAPGLRAVAWAHSNHGRIVEGLEGAGSRWLVGIQCHPERTDSTPVEFAGLWRAFVAAAARFAAGSRPRP